MLKNLTAPALVGALVLAPGLALAAGGGGSTPATTSTTKQCTKGQIYDADSKACVDAQESSLTDDERYDAAREFAYVGQYGAARAALEAMTVQTDGRVQTYLGFTARKLGDMDQAMVHYTAALEQDPDNILARSYMGQGYAELGDMDAAKMQLTEIRKRGGRNTWAEFSLAQAIRTGAGYAY
ncbi:tetratricopeptide repeat protein [Pseudaestuariivita sp.]|uniref:tetratricopeptide repeat protein n=1 Tax=Pseudaestuariivita sp. TaxID=2211669 RepID=UPI004059013B